MLKMLIVLAFIPLFAFAQEGKRWRVKLETTKGTIVIELDGERAPKSAENFLAYVRAGHYDGTVFHRVIPGFMIQGGGVGTDLRPKENRQPIPNEAANGLKNTRGSIAMARTGEIDSATSQFFINLVDNTFLDHQDRTPRGYGYAVFGAVVEGMDVVDAIAALPTGPAGPFRSDVPKEPVVITAASVVGR
jgi:peptidyl-prolyl cis-trans isomerase B (cyclophilin B)